MDFSTLQEAWWLVLLLCLGGYLLGSVSSAILICKALGYPDPRTEGSSNPGATNVLRIAGKPAAAMTLAGDVLKGVLPVLAAVLLNQSMTVAALAGFCAFLGHLFPAFFQLRGGKGVATAFGLIFALHWPSGLVTGATWLLVFGLFRVSSLASMLAFIAMPVAIHMWLPAAFWPMLLLTAMLLARHHSNIRNLLTGKELGFRNKQ
ncbi:glycerol-3-phosphate 1-O-acyltransferase PlsY [Alcanivorax sp. JB21]|uniref:glycerol-3-phosphate 1-O-acyltransferase PlsY n=1 Tax=Alcanivorax limicola TaxID=2874102 RepID=UPI001CBFBD54|nr:glycerol-3-phosphate 1-O-acyltransferase PlsY [Alcanivorax limicola]MBZ2190093.1 glycerol-3-phosphate 1-O-acyltransferase PlsY [Alcanivorax limicola]